MYLKLVIWAFCYNWAKSYSFCEEKTQIYEGTWNLCAFVQESMFFLEKITPLAKIVHCRRQWQEWQITPLFKHLPDCKSLFDNGWCGLYWGGWVVCKKAATLKQETLKQHSITPLRLTKTEIYENFTQKIPAKKYSYKTHEFCWNLLFVPSAPWMNHFKSIYTEGKCVDNRTDG